MKKIVLMVAAYCIATTLNAQDGFVIKGKLKGQGNLKMNLVYVDANKQVVRDTNIVASGDDFTIKGVLHQEPVVAYLNTKLDRNIYVAPNKKGMFVPAPALEVVLTNHSKIKITGTAADINLSIVKGDELNESLNRMRKAEEALVKEMWMLQQQSAELRIKEDREGAAAAGKKVGELREKRTAIRKRFTNDNPAEFASIYLLSTMGADYGPGELAETYDHLANLYKSTSFGKAVVAKVEAMSATALGKIAPNFTKPDTNGSPFELASLKGKYVLVDFWGSWCGPCRASHPHLKKVYAEYKDKGFEILGIANEKISGLEDAKKAWLNAIQNDGITWKQVINNDGVEQSDITRLYGIEGYPTKLLLDREGKIIAKWIGMENEELDAKLKEIFGN